MVKTLRRECHGHIKLQNDVIKKEQEGTNNIMTTRSNAQKLMGR